MEIFDKIIADITENQLENFELENQSRKYIEYTLFQIHYYYFISKPEPPDYISNYFFKLNMNSTDDDMEERCESDKDDFLTTSSSSSLVENESTGTEVSSEDKINYPKISQIWNILNARQQHFWYKSALMLNKTPLLGLFTTIPEPLLHNNILSQEKLLNAIKIDWQRFLKMLRSSLTRNSSIKQSACFYKFLNQAIYVGKQSYRRV